MAGLPKAGLGSGLDLAKQAIAVYPTKNSELEKIKKIKSAFKSILIEQQYVIYIYLEQKVPVEVN